MTLFGFTEATSVAAWIAVALAVLPGMALSKESVRFFHSLWPMSSASTIAIHVMMPMWYLVFGAIIAVSGFFFTNDSPADNAYFVAGFVLMIVNLLLFRAYHMVFWHGKMMRVESRVRWAFGLMALLTATAIATTVMMGLINTVPGNTPNVYLAYTIPWAVYSFILLLHWPMFFWYFLSNTVSAPGKVVRRVLGIRSAASGASDVEAPLLSTLEIPRN